MSSKKFGLILSSLLAHGLLLFSRLVHCDESEYTLFNAMNSYRSSLNLSTLIKNSRAQCLAEQIAWEFDDQSPFSIAASGSVIAPGNLTQLPDFPDYLTKCEIDLNHTENGVIMPLHIPRLALNLVLTNCTRSEMARYLRKPVYSSIGIGYYEDWAVFVLGTNSLAGSFSSSATFSGLGNCGFLISFLLLFVIFGSNVG